VEGFFMKLAIAAACLVATLSVASHAFADGATHVNLQQPVAKPIEFVVTGAVWHCADTSCIAVSTPDQTFGANQCHDVAKHAGAAVSEFKDAYKSLDAAGLDKCNANIVAKTSVAAAH
jgi:hypothetical protein